MLDDLIKLQNRGIDLFRSRILLVARGADFLHQFRRTPDVRKDRHDDDARLLRDALQRGLKVVDSTAFSLCMDNNMDMHVFGMEPAGNVTRALLGERIGTLVTV